MLLKDFNETFEFVKFAVEARFNMHRAGISLVLQGLPTTLGAYHVLGSNLIIINRRILAMIKARKLLEYNSYLFTVLGHEYLHSFGIVSELEVRRMIFSLCLSMFGEDHIASIMARYGPWYVFPDLNLDYKYEPEQTYETIRDFDKTTQSYIY